MPASLTKEQQAQQLFIPATHAAITELRSKNDTRYTDRLTTDNGKEVGIKAAIYAQWDKYITHRRTEFEAAESADAIAQKWAQEAAAAIVSKLIPYSEKSKSRNSREWDTTGRGKT